MKAKFAIIGFGGMGHHHAGMIRESLLGEVIGIFDIDKAVCDKAQLEGQKVFASVEELLASKADIVLVATPNDSHFDYVVRSLKAHKHVLCEKPATMSAKLYHEMARVATENGVTLTVHQNRRLDKDYLIMKEIFASKIIGDIYRIESRVMASNDIPGGWRKKIAKGGGMMLDWGVHLIDQANQIMEIKDIDCEYSYILGHEVEDGFSARLHGDKLEYLVEVDTNCFLSVPRWQIFGTFGSAIITDWDCNGSIIRISGGENNPQSIKAGNGFTRTMANRDKCSIVNLPLPVVKEEPYAFYRGMLKAISEKKNYIPHDGVERVLELMELAGKKARKLFK